MTQRTLRKTVLAALGTAALATSTTTSAMSYHDINLGPLKGKMRGVHRGGVPPESFSGFRIKNQGWFHTAKFYRFSVGTADELAAGKQYKVTITMRGRQTRTDDEVYDGPLQYPSFTVWAMGSNPFRAPDATCHGWSQLRGPNDDVLNPLSVNPGKLPNGEVVTANNTDNNDLEGLGDGTIENPTPNGIQDGCLLYVGVVDGRDGWVGYAYTGPDAQVRILEDPFNDSPQTKNGTEVIDALPRGWFVNHQSPFVDGAASSGKVVWDRKFNRAKLVLRGVKPGGYLIGAGGGCATLGGTPGAWTSACSQPQTGDAYTMTVETRPEAE